MSPLQIMQFLDSISYLPDDILTKVDHASMAVGLEARVPLLDTAVYSFSCRLPSQFKTRAGPPKWILRQLLGRYLPRRLFDRPKQGFEVPMSSWLRVDLRDWAESLLDEHRLNSQGLFDFTALRQIWRDYLHGNNY